MGKKNAQEFLYQDRIIIQMLNKLIYVSILPDYKAILSKGKLRCAGSSLFLKNRFGIGYHLKLVLARSLNVTIVSFSLEFLDPFAPKISFSVILLTVCNFCFGEFGKFFLK